MSKTHHYQPAGDVTITATGNLDDLDVAGCALVLMSNATLATIRGLKAGYPGQIVAIASVGAGHVFLAHQSSGSVAANRLINVATSAPTPLAAGIGTALLEYDAVAARWRLIAHEQGAWITPAYSAGAFTANGAMTWTVDAGDVVVYAYWLKGRTLYIWYGIVVSSIGGTLNTSLRIAVPAGFLAAKTIYANVQISNAAAASVGLVEAPSSPGTYLGLYRDASQGLNWLASANNTSLLGQIGIEVQ